MSYFNMLYETGKVLASYPPEDLNFEFPPLFHARNRADAEITLDKDGNLVAVTLMKERPFILHPLTLQSMSRTSNAKSFPHPLADKLANIAYSEQAYLESLSAWYDSCKHPSLFAIMEYMKRETLKDDVLAAGGSEESFLCWTVTGTSAVARTYEDSDLMYAWILYYEKLAAATERKIFCMISGEMDVYQPMHPKAILNADGHSSAKMISAADTENFTYLGQLFWNAEQAACIGVHASHYVHQALKYLLAHGGIRLGNGDTFLSWCPKEPLLSTAEGLLSPKKDIPFAWSKEFWNKSLFGERFADLGDTYMPIASMIIGGATPGRLSVKYYEESDLSTFERNVNLWHYGCAWERYDAEKKEMVPYYPSLYSLINWAYGTDKNGRMTAADGEFQVWLSKLLQRECRGEGIPREIVKSLISRVNHSEIYGHSLWAVALAALRKWKIDTTGEVFDAMVDLESRDRSYLFGRLLAIYDKMEKSYFRKDETRTTNAMRLQPMFVDKPLKTAKILDGYAKRVWCRRIKPGLRYWYFEKLNELWALLEALDGETLGDKLGDTYLFGYYGQKQYMYKKQNESDEEDKNNE